MCMATLVSPPFIPAKTLERQSQSEPRRNCEANSSHFQHSHLLVVAWPSTPLFGSPEEIPIACGHLNNATNKNEGEREEQHSQAAISFLTDLVGSSFGLGPVVSILNAPLYIVDKCKCVILFDHFRSVIEDATSESFELIGSFLQKVSIAFEEKNRGILAFTISKAPFSTS